MLLPIITNHSLSRRCVPHDFHKQHQQRLPSATGSRRTPASFLLPQLYCQLLALLWAQQQPCLKICHWYCSIVLSFLTSFYVRTYYITGKCLSFIIYFSVYLNIFDVALFIWHIGINFKINIFLLVFFIFSTFTAHQNIISHVNNFCFRCITDAWFSLFAVNWVVLKLP